MNDPYLYENSEVLKNELKIKDNAELKKVEFEFSANALRELSFSPLTGNYDFTHYCKFHEHVFKDVYEWAGRPRDINIEKSEPALGGLSVEYADHFDIKRLSESELKKMKSIEWDKLSLDDKATEFSKSIAKLWKVHPFREGNTRTIITFCSKFAESKGIVLDTSLFKDNATYLRTSLVAANADFKDLGNKSKPEYLIKIVKDSMQKGLEKELDTAYG